MPRFYFNVFDDTVCFDNEGVELPDVFAVRELALEVAREVLALDIMEKGTIKLGYRIEVEDEGGRPVLTLPFRSAVTIED